MFALSPGAPFPSGCIPAYVNLGGDSRTFRLTAKVLKPPRSQSCEWLAASCCDLSRNLRLPSVWREGTGGGAAQD